MIKDFWNSDVEFDRIEFITKYAKNKTVLNIGCIGNINISNPKFPNNWSHNKIMKSAKSVIGLDINQPFIQLLRKIGYNIMNLNLSHEILEPEALLNLGQFQLIVIGELIEHISNLEIFFHNVKNLLCKDGYILVTTPNASSLSFFLGGLMRKKRVLSSQHLCIYSIETISNLLSIYDFKIVKWKYYTCSPRYKIAKKLVFSLTPQLAAGLIVIAKNIPNYEIPCNKLQVHI